MALTPASAHMCAHTSMCVKSMMVPQKSKHSNKRVQFLKTGKAFEQTVPKRIYTNIQLAREKKYPMLLAFRHT